MDFIVHKKFLTMNYFQAMVHTDIQTDAHTYTHVHAQIHINTQTHTSYTPLTCGCCLTRRAELVLLAFHIRANHAGRPLELFLCKNYPATINTLKHIL